MFTALLLPLLVAVSPGGLAARQGGTSGGDDPAVQLWISNDRRFLPGDHAKIQFRLRSDGYLLVLHVDPDGHLRVLFPLDPKDDAFIRGGQKYELLGRGDREVFTVDNRTGRGTVYAAVSHDPMRFDQFMVSDHWDYRNLAPQRLSTDPEQELNDLVRQMVDGGFDYDILTYDVLERVVYADQYSSTYDGYYGGYWGFGGFYGGCGYWYYDCHHHYGSPFGLSIGFQFGTPYFGAYYGAYYDPFYYAPYYYSPIYAYPYYRYPYYGYPYHSYPYHGYPAYGYPYHNQYYPPGHNGPYTPYRFRPADGTLAGYQGRYDLRRPVNAAHQSPVGRDRQPMSASPGRRVSNDRPAAGTPAPGAQRAGAQRAGAQRREAQRGEAQRTDAQREGARRAVDRSAGDHGAARRPERSPTQRMEQPSAGRPNIEARRAREPEERRSVVPDSRDFSRSRDMPTEIRPPTRSNPPARLADEGPRRAVVDRPGDGGQQVLRGGDGQARGWSGGGDDRGEPQLEPRRAEPRGDAGYAPRAEPRSEPSGGGDRGGWSAPPSRGGGSGGGGGGGGGSGGSSGGGSSGGSWGGGRRR